MRITERRLRKIIRSVIRESMTSGTAAHNMEDAIQACRSGNLEDPSINDNEIQDEIMEYILLNHTRDLDYANPHSGSGPLEDMYSGEEYISQLRSQRIPEDYELVISNMAPNEYDAMLANCGSMRY